MLRTHPRPPARTLLALAALCAALSGAPGPARAQPAPGADLRALLDEARRASPEIAAMRLEADAATQRALSASALPDPVLRVELENVNNYGSDARPSLLPSKVGETKYTLMQMLPLAGKRELRRDLATADARQAEARAAAAWTELAMRVKTLHSQYYLVAGNERLTREVIGLLAHLGQLAQARYAGGLVPQQDAIRAQLEQTAMSGELIMIEAQKRQLRGRLNALLAREPAAPLAEPQALRPLPPPAAFADLLQRARANNPVWRAEAARLQGAEANRELTWRNRYPDVNVGISPTQMGSRITTWSLMVELNLPLQQSARRAQEREAVAMVDVARARADAVVRQLEGDLAEQLAGLEAARRTEALIGTQVLPQSELSLQSALAAYENGKVDFATLLEAQRQIRKARQDLLKAQVEAQMRFAEIERTVGEEL